MVLSSVGAVAWATGGLSQPIDRVAVTDPVWVVVSDGATTLVVSSVEVDRLRAEHDPAGLGFEVIGAPWYEATGHLDVVADVVGAPASACVSDGAVGADVSDELVEARLALCGAELAVLEGLARDATLAVEGAVIDWRPGSSTDLEVAAHVQADLEAVGADAVCLIVGGDDRVRSFRHPLATGAVVADLLMVVVVARRQGLHVALTRLGAARPDEALERRLVKCDEIHSHVMAALRAGATWGDAYRALGEGYRLVGEPDAWREHFQGGPIGYAQREFELAPSSAASPWWPREVSSGTAVAWNPSLTGGGKIEDTYVVEADGVRLLTDSGAWARRDGHVAGAALLVK